MANADDRRRSGPTVAVAGPSSLPLARTPHATRRLRGSPRKYSGAGNKHSGNSIQSAILAKSGDRGSGLEAVDPLTTSQEFRFKLPSSPEDKDKDVVLYLTASDAGDGDEHDEVLWERPRLVSPGRPDLLLRDLRPATIELAKHRDQLFASPRNACLPRSKLEALTERARCGRLGSKVRRLCNSAVRLAGLSGHWRRRPRPSGARWCGKRRVRRGYDFIQGWVGDDALSVMANASDEHVRIPGNMLRIASPSIQRPLCPWRLAGAVR